MKLWHIAAAGAAGYFAYCYVAGGKAREIKRLTENLNAVTVALQGARSGDPLYVNLTRQQIAITQRLNDLRGQRVK